MNMKSQRIEEASRAAEREWKRITEFYKRENKNIFKDKSSKKSGGLANEFGLDRVHLKYSKEDIVILGPGKNIDRIFIEGTHFKFKSGYHFKHWYSKLEVNLPKMLYGNNILNIRQRDILYEAIRKIEKELIDEEVSLEVIKGILIYLEVNKNVELDKEFTQYSEASKIMLDDREPIIQKKFTPNSIFENPFSGWKAGKKNKMAVFYDKCYEQVKEVFKSNEYFAELPKKELIRIARKFITLARLEFQISKDPLQLLLKNILMKEDVTLGDLALNLEENLDDISSQMLEEIGFSTSLYKKAKEAKKKRLVRLFKQFIRMHPHNFISAILKYRHSHLWGASQGVEVFKEIGGPGNIACSRGHDFKKEFLKIRNLSHRVPDYIGDMEELIEKFN